MIRLLAPMAVVASLRRTCFCMPGARSRRQFYELVSSWRPPARTYAIAPNSPGEGYAQSARLPGGGRRAFRARSLFRTRTWVLPTDTILVQGNWRAVKDTVEATYEWSRPRWREW
jgi:hypothetical protein